MRAWRWAATPSPTHASSRPSRSATGGERHPGLPVGPFVQDKTSDPRWLACLARPGSRSSCWSGWPASGLSSFRPGYLSYPFQLPEALQATGYLYSSSVTANACLTHLPHQTTFSRQGESLTPVYEFPVTIEDEELPRLGDRFEAESAVIAKIAAHHGLVVILIHPDILDHKLAFEQQLIARWKGRAWMPDLEEFGAWWRARDKADIDVIEDGRGWALTVDAPEELRHLAVILPKAAGAAGSGRLVLDGVRGHRSIGLKGAPTAAQ